MIKKYDKMIPCPSMLIVHKHPTDANNPSESLQKTWKRKDMYISQPSQKKMQLTLNFVIKTDPHLLISMAA